jgi:putative salt-induced outer membrane protein YdiY
MQRIKTHHLATLSAAGAILAGAPGAVAQISTNAPWEKSAAVGLTLTRGNSDTLLFTANFLAARKGKENEFFLGADATYGENDDVKNAESLHGFVQYNRLFSDRWYGYARVDGLHDAIADIEYRFTLSPGVGYYFIKNETTRLNAEVGPGFVYEKQGDDTSGYFTVRLAERFEHKFNDRVRIWQSLEFLPQVDDFNNYILNAEIGVESALTKKLSLRAYLQDTYDNEPAMGREKNDLKLVTALGYKF